MLDAIECMCDQSLAGSLAALQTQVNNGFSDVNERIDSLNTVLGGFDPADFNGASIADYLTYVETQIIELHKSDTIFKESVYKEVLEIIQSTKDTIFIDCMDSLAQVTKQIEAKYTDVSSKLDSAIAEHNKAVANLQQQINTANANIDNLEAVDDSLAAAVKAVETSLVDLTKRVEANETAIKTLQTDLNTLTGRVDEIANRLNQLITSIIIQSVYNPVYGNFSTPLDVNSNILIGAYGEATQDYTFPSNSSVAEYNNKVWFTPEDLAMLGLSGNINALDVYQGDKLYNGTNGVNVGKVYMTINPTDVDFSGTKFDLVNSQDYPSGVTLSSPVSSSKVLTFGYSRAANNGFYESDATVPEDKIAKLNISATIDSNLKQAAKDAFNNRTQSDFTALAAAVAKTIKSVSPFEAFGLKAAWTANGNDVATYSNYGIAAAVYKPLSFKFLHDVNVKDIPTISPLTDFEFDMSKFSFNVNMPTIRIDESEVTFHLDSVKLNSNHQLEVTIRVPDVKVGEHWDGTYKYETYAADSASVAEFLKDVENSMNGQITNWNDQVKAEMEKEMNALIDEINTQVQDAMDKLGAEVNDEFKKLLDEISDEVSGSVDKYIDKANSLIDKYNSVVNRINGYLDNPNHYLQVMMVYKCADGDFHRLSTSKDYPSVFKLAGGNAVSLYTTTYNAEIIAPAVKKFIGVTNVWDADGNNAQAGDATCQQLLKDANANDLMANVVTGKTIRVPLKVSKAGYTYEIVYSALDYHGVTSTNKYYVTVK